MTRFCRLFIAGLLIGAAPVMALPLRICANEALGPPEAEHSAYLMMRLALRQLPGLEVDYTPLPWQRCLREAAAGQFDAVLSASHSDERARGLVYPRDAQGRPDAERRMFMIGYVLLKRRDSAVAWDGERFLGSSARPGEAVGAERGYSIVAFARGRGAYVEDRYPSFASLMDALRLKRSAGVLVHQEAAAALLADAEWAQAHELGGPPMAPKPYFLPFSRAFADAHPQQVERIWAALARVRQQPAFREAFSLGMTGGRRRDLPP